MILSVNQRRLMAGQGSAGRSKLRGASLLAGAALIPLFLGAPEAAAGELPIFLREKFAPFGSLAPREAWASPALSSASSFETDEYRSSWYLGHIHASEAYAMGYTGKGVTVAVVDSGIDFNHPEFAGRISPLSYSYAIDRDPLDLSDTDFDGQIEGHGTHVSGIVGAARDGRGTMGVAHDATIMVLRTNYRVGAAGEYPPNLGLVHAANNGAKVINGSYGPMAFPPKEIETASGVRVPNPHWVLSPSQIVTLGGLENEYEAVKAAAKKDVVMVFAAGNEYQDQPIAASHPSGIALFPYIRPENHKKGIYSFLIDASDYRNPKTYKLADMNDPDFDEVDLSDLYGTLVAVVSTNSQGKISSFSNRCGVAALWCIAAPGGDRPRDGEARSEALIQSTYPYGTYGLMAGTSMAAPVVSGGAAVLRQAFPYMTARQVIEVILTTATPMGSPEIYGRGMFNLGRAVQGPYEFGAEGFAQVFDVNTKGYDSVWSNDIRGTGGLIKRGEGNLVLTGENSYAGGTDVLGGIFTLNGSVKSRLAVHVNATLRGLGRIDAPLTVAGALDPGGASGGSIGTLTVNGDASLLKTSTYRADADGSGQHDKLDVSGQAKLAGGRLEVSLVNSTAPVNKRMTLLSAEKGSLGRFGAFQTNSQSAYLIPDLEYGTNDLSVTFRRNGISLSGAAQTDNQASVASAAEGLGVGNSVNDALVQNSIASTPGALDSLSGEAHGTVISAAYGDAALVSGALLGRLRKPLASPAAGNVQATYAADGPRQQADLIQYPMLDSRVFALWGEGFGSWGEIGSDGNAGSVNTSRGGFILGADASIDQNYRVGLAGGFTSTDIDIDSRHSSGSNESVFGTIYGAAKWGAVNLRLGASYAAHDIHMNRNIGFIGFQDRVTSSYDGSTMQAFGEIGYGFGLGGAQFEPFIGGSILRTHTDAFVEEGGIAALTGFSRDHDLATTTLGLRAQAQLGENLPLTLRGMLGWRHTYGDVDPKVLLSLSGGAAAFAVAGVPIDRDALVAEASLDWQATQAISVGLAYQGQIGKHAHEHAVKGNLTWRFETR